MQNIKSKKFDQRVTNKQEDDLISGGWDKVRKSISDIDVSI